LGVQAFSEMNDVIDTFDVFFSAHVLEHVPAVSGTLEFARKVLRRGGWFVALTPNGSNHFRVARPEAWNQLWGLVHPNFLDERFYRHAFKDDAYLLASPPYDLSAIVRWASSPTESISLDMSGDELLVIANLRRNA
jgi:2-polyprenyl-3-methyl-5-hydroxy-6-metoxy-1,4-benzoquinol methylase